MFWENYKRILKFISRQIPGFQLRRILLNAAGYKIGRNVYIGEDLIIIDEMKEKGNLIIGDRVAIAERVTLIISSKPNFSNILPYAPIAHGPIYIQEDAWLGTGVIVFPNVTIGKGAIVGAGSIVTKDVPSYTIVVGSPAKPIRKLVVTDSKPSCPSSSLLTDLSISKQNFSISNIKNN